MTGAETPDSESRKDTNEVPFSFDELFFSRTDERGIILSGNSVFRRISQYSWDELYKKPHNIIRHPDMPKGVFYLLWAFLKQGKPIAAYVKNRAKDGRHYWVFAIATPIEGGYLSVRLKPSSDFFSIIQEEYKALLAYEREQGKSPKESMEKAAADLKSLGFGSYDEFMSVALRKEIEARDEQLGRKKGAFLDRFENLSQRASALIKGTENILFTYEGNRFVPLNLQIQAAKLGDQGKTIGVISGNFSEVSEDIKKGLDIFKDSAREVFDKIYEGQFLLSVAKMQSEVADFFRKETGNGDQDGQEIISLEKQQREYQERASTGLEAIMRNIAKFQEDCRRMKKCASSLEVIRIMGKVDAARLSVSHDGLNGLMDDLQQFQSAISESLSEIEKHNANMKSDTQSIMDSLERA